MRQLLATAAALLALTVPAFAEGDCGEFRSMKGGTIVFGVPEDELMTVTQADGDFEVCYSLVPETKTETIYCGDDEHGAEMTWNYGPKDELETLVLDGETFFPTCPAART